LPAVVDSIGQSRSSLSAQVEGIGSLSITHGDLVDGIWTKRINADGIDENSVRASAMKVQAVSMLAAGNEHQGRMIASVMDSNEMTDVGSAQYMNRVNAARFAGPPDAGASRFIEAPPVPMDTRPTFVHPVGANVHQTVHDVNQATTGQYDIYHGNPGPQVGPPVYSFQMAPGGQAGPGQSVRRGEVEELHVDASLPKSAPRQRKMVVSTDVERGSGDWEDTESDEEPSPVFVRKRGNNRVRRTHLSGSFRRPGVPPAEA
jgi:hypothetical protein